MCEFINKYILSEWKFWIGVILLALLTNQIAQPLFKPRISDITIEPIRIQYVESKKDYFLVAELIYEIEVPVFPLSNEILLDVPRNEDNNILLNTKFIQSTPYIRLFTLNATIAENFIVLTPQRVYVNTSIFQNKKLSVSFFIFQKTDEKLEQLTEWSDYFFYNEYSISPELSIDCALATSNTNLLGYGKTRSGYHRFDYQIIQNKCPLDFNSYQLKLPFQAEDITSIYDTYCDGYNELYEVEGFASLDVKAGEEKVILFIRRDEKPRIYNHTIAFDWIAQTNSPCLYAWKSVKELGLFE